MVCSINIYYNNRTVQAVVELKNKPTMWHLAKKITLTSGQTDLKISMRTFKQYENLCSVLDALLVSQLIQEFVATVVKMFFNVTNAELSTMMKKDPFLCNSCGFCKYAKFEYSLTARPCCAVDPIENEEDRKKALANINSLLKKQTKFIDSWLLISQN